MPKPPPMPPVEGPSPCAAPFVLLGVALLVLVLAGLFSFLHVGSSPCR